MSTARGDGATEKTVLHNIIGGESVPATDGAAMDIIDPTTGEVYATAPLSGPGDVDRAYAAATEAFQSWRWATPSERQKALLDFADHVEDNAEELVAIEVQDTGKPTSLTMSEEIGPMVDQLRFFAGAARVLEGKSAGEYMRGHTSSMRREPVGVVGQVAPWNYPMMMGVWKIAPALAAGCTVVLKPSDTTPASSVWMGQGAAELLPAGRRQRPLWRPRHGRGPDVPQGPGARLHHRVHRRRHRRRHGGGEERHPRAPRARRQGAGRRLRRRLARGRGRGHRHRRLLQRRPGLHGSDPGDRAGRASTTSSSRR